MSGIAWAQGAGGAAAGPSPLVNLLPIALMFVILYFLLIRPQQKRAREHDTMVQNLKRDDDIVTTGGIYGRIQALADKMLDRRDRAERADPSRPRSGRRASSAARGRKTATRAKRQGEGMKLGYRALLVVVAAAREQRLPAADAVQTAAVVVAVVPAARAAAARAWISRAAST